MCLLAPRWYRRLASKLSLPSSEGKKLPTAAQVYNYNGDKLGNTINTEWPIWKSINVTNSNEIARNGDKTDKNQNGPSVELIKRLDLPWEAPHSSQLRFSPTFPWRHPSFRARWRKSEKEHICCCRICFKTEYEIGLVCVPWGMWLGHSHDTEMHF